MEPAMELPTQTSPRREQIRTASQAAVPHKKKMVTPQAKTQEADRNSLLLLPRVVLFKGFLYRTFFVVFFETFY
jgi:hypothetical protein